MNPYSDLLLSVCLGIGLSAACGFRVFIPLLVLSGASLIGSVHLVPELFATAAVFEVAAYYIPWVDHLMDTIAGPAAAVAGALVMASSLTDMGPLLKWTLAVIAGTGSAALVQGSTMLARGLSTTLTGGMGNPAVYCPARHGRPGGSGAHPFHDPQGLSRQESRENRKTRLRVMSLCATPVGGGGRS